MGTENGLGGGREMMHDDPSFRSSPFLPSEEEKARLQILAEKARKLEKKRLAKNFPSSCFLLLFLSPLLRLLWEK